MSKGKWTKYKSYDGTKRTQQVRAAVSPVEKNLIKEYADALNLTVSEYLLVQALYSDNLQTVALRQEMQDVTAELKRYGNNLNQATKQINIAMKSIELEPLVCARKLEKACDVIIEEQKQRNYLRKEIAKFLDRSKNVNQ